MYIDRAFELMRDLGNFGPTVNVKDRMVKGYTHVDGEGAKTYWTSDDLRAIAEACVYVAGWLDDRAESAEQVHAK